MAEVACVKCIVIYGRWCVGIVGSFEELFEISLLLIEWNVYRVKTG